MAQVTSRTKLSELKAGFGPPARTLKTARRASCEVSSNRSASKATTYARKFFTPHFDAPLLDIRGKAWLVRDDDGTSADALEADADRGH